MQPQHLAYSKKAEKRVKRQLVEAMIFEGIIKYKETETADSYSIFYLFGENRTYRCEGRRTAFDRIRIKEASIFKECQDHSLVEATIEELAGELIRDGEHKLRLINELNQTIKLCSWNELHLPQPASRRKSAYEELESEIMEGHPYHPCFKSRTGFTIEDHKKYGPEAKQAFHLKWIAVRRSLIQTAICRDEQDFFKEELGSFMWEELLKQLESMGGTFDHYTFLPVHPWQWETMKPELMKYMETRDILPLDVSGNPYRATQSVRTLWNAAYPEKAYMKFSMNMVNTSSLRKLASHSICAAPHISSWIQKVIQKDPYLQKEASLVILQEYAGMIFEAEEEKLDGQLGVIWRESIRAYIQDGEEAVPFTALMMIEKDGNLFIDDWLKNYGSDNWLKQFIKVSVLPVWHLLAAHGIAVEAHAQNMVLLHKNGWPTRVILRDFHESVEYTEGFLADASLVPSFEEIHERYKDAPEDDYYWMSSVEALRELIMDTLFVFHLSELSFLMEEHYGYKEKHFWNKVGKLIEEHIERFPDLITRQQEFPYKKAEIYVESLLKKKVKNKEEGNFRHLVRNVFCHIQQEEEK
ncbi:IucA/IucC family protein [Metabacillus fastidiosus]|uniref:IucA/IucC family protein n=1 Tax=Metabacillus fastidiosus TaxID=1458 RepID=UPI002E1BC511|nr:IucA/IucC family protein [Metabacillus fastidiosus]MED4453996.1 IucA/IucC family protein [Metabacillus fastidiosus]